MDYSGFFREATRDPKESEDPKKRSRSRAARVQELRQLEDVLFAYSLNKIREEEESYKFDSDDFFDPEGTGDEEYNDPDAKPSEGGVTPSGSGGSSSRSDGGRESSGGDHSSNFNATNKVTALAEEKNPLAGHRMTSGFGMREHPVHGGRRAHKGIDIGAASGTDIKAATDARVAHSGWVNGYGNVVILSHGSGVYSMYAHLSNSDVRAGQTVRAGQKFADVGNTGVGTGAHLHYELLVRQGGRVTNIDPSKFSLADLANADMRDRAVANGLPTRIAGLAKRDNDVFTAQAAQTAAAQTTPTGGHHDGDGHGHDHKPAAQLAAVKPSPATSRESFNAAHDHKPAETGVVATLTAAKDATLNFFSKLNPFA